MWGRGRSRERAPGADETARPERHGRRGTAGEEGMGPACPQAAAAAQTAAFLEAAGLKLESKSRVPE